MDAIKNAAKSALSGSHATTGAAGQPQAQTGQTAGAGGPAGMINQGIDAAQAGGYIPKTGTQQGNMVDAGQKAYTQYQAKNPQ
ncbi:hypothetical protein HDU86_002072 [Geranomyces michiganensis]|nr:hypothetical protein HDU86_002072 [Geranomyces michiganensis]